MKKLFLLIPVICFLSFPILTAQMSQGQIMIGVSSSMNLGVYTWGSDFMNLNFLSTKYKNVTVSDADKTTGFTILPRIGYVLYHNFATGLDIIYSSYSWNYSNENEDSESLFCVGPFVRYYYTLPKFSPYAEINGAIGVETEKYNYGNLEGDNKWSIKMFGIGIGAALPLGERVTFDAQTGYNSISYKQKGEDEREIIGSIGLKMGFTVFLR